MKRPLFAPLPILTIAIVTVAAGIVILLVGLSVAPATAGDEPDIDVVDAWATATIGPMRTSALYFRLRNRGSRTERLLAAETPDAEKVEFHINIRDGDVLRMRPVSAIELPPGETVIMRQGGLHGMVLGLRRAFKEGDSMPVTLVFDATGAVEVSAEVRAFARRRP